MSTSNVRTYNILEGKPLKDFVDFNEELNPNSHSHSNILVLKLEVPATFCRVCPRLRRAKAALYLAGVTSCAL